VRDEQAEAVMRSGWVQPCAVHLPVDAPEATTLIALLNARKDMSMTRVTLVKLLVNDQDEALDFYTEKLGFEVAEDSRLGEYRWVLVRLPDNEEFCTNLDVAKTDDQKALVGRGRSRPSIARGGRAAATGHRRATCRTTPDSPPAPGTGWHAEPHARPSGRR
jgi:catechol 2,3-dioxygenase-like lactoylglutathione lyase family enzyme